ncbi:MAG: nucleoside hydrolase [Candidatus Hodarchaeota archaeon]
MNKNYAKLIMLLFILMLSPVNTLEFEVSTSSQSGIEVIVDMDAAKDDWASILYLLKHPDINVLGIGVSCGVSYVDQGTMNTLRILDYLEIRDIPVAAGKETPLIVDHEFPSAWRDASHWFYGLDLPETDLAPSPMNASDLIISLIENSSGNVTIVALGPLTNVAIALETEPSIKSKIDEIVLMGGALDVLGNVGLESEINNDVAEWNLWVDPHAADIVLKSGLPIMMVPLDATNQVPQTNAFLDRLESIMKTIEAQLLYEMTTVGLYFWDQLTVVALTNPEVVTLESHYIEIVVDLAEHEGQTISTDIENPNAWVAMSADRFLFEDLFIGYINDDLPTPTVTTTSEPIDDSDFDPLIIYLAIGGLGLLIIIIIILKKNR